MRVNASANVNVCPSQVHDPREPMAIQCSSWLLSKLRSKFPASQNHDRARPLAVWRIGSLAIQGSTAVRIARLRTFVSFHTEIWFFWNFLFPVNSYETWVAGDMVGSGASHRCSQPRSRKVFGSFHLLVREVLSSSLKCGVTVVLE